MSGSGDYPIGPRRRGADASHMIALDTRRAPRTRIGAPAARSAARFRRAAAPDRAARIVELRAELAAGTYAPDPAAVAEALVEHLQARQCS
jgi:anti-sigma28 factor (negative regulator of flagellin synthesis)